MIILLPPPPCDRCRARRDVVRLPVSPLAGASSTLCRHCLLKEGVTLPIRCGRKFHAAHARGGMLTVGHPGLAGGGAELQALFTRKPPHCLSLLLALEAGRWRDWGDSRWIQTPFGQVHPRTVPTAVRRWADQVWNAAWPVREGLAARLRGVLGHQGHLIFFFRREGPSVVLALGVHRTPFLRWTAEGWQVDDAGLARAAEASAIEADTLRGAAAAALAEADPGRGGGR